MLGKKFRGLLSLLAIFTTVCSQDIYHKDDKRLFCTHFLGTGASFYTSYPEVGTFCTDIILVGSLEQYSDCSAFMPICIMASFKNVFQEEIPTLLVMKSNFPGVRFHLSTTTILEKLSEGAEENWEIKFTAQRLVNSLRLYDFDGLVFMLGMTGWRNKDEGNFFKRVREVIDAENHDNKDEKISLSVIVPAEPPVDVTHHTSLDWNTIDSLTDFFLLQSPESDAKKELDDFFFDVVAKASHSLAAYKKLGLTKEKLILGFNLMPTLYQSDGEMFTVVPHTTDIDLCSSTDESDQPPYTLRNGSMKIEWNNQSDEFTQVVTKLKAEQVQKLTELGKTSVAGVVEWAVDPTCWERRYNMLTLVKHTLLERSHGCLQTPVHLSMTFKPLLRVYRRTPKWPMIVYKISNDHKVINITCVAKTSSEKTKWDWRTKVSSKNTAGDNNESYVTQSIHHFLGSSCRYYVHESTYSYHLENSASDQEHEIACSVSLQPGQMGIYERSVVFKDFSESLNTANIMANPLLHMKAESEDNDDRRLKQGTVLVILTLLLVTLAFGSAVGAKKLMKRMQEDPQQQRGDAVEMDNDSYRIRQSRELIIKGQALMPTYEDPVQSTQTGTETQTQTGPGTGAGTHEV